MAFASTLDLGVRMKGLSLANALLSIYAIPRKSIESNLKKMKNGMMPVLSVIHISKKPETS